MHALNLLLLALLAIGGFVLAVTTHAIGGIILIAIALLAGATIPRKSPVSAIVLVAIAIGTALAAREWHRIQNERRAASQPYQPR